jgi:uncharacterized phage protein (TIGR01671 family)
MKREIIFRGKRVDNGEWVYGDRCRSVHNNSICIMPKPFFATRDFGEEDEFGSAVIEDSMAIGGWYSVDPETVGQYIGIKDDTNKHIYEGDFVLFETEDSDVLIGVASFDHGEDEWWSGFVMNKCRDASEEFFDEHGNCNIQPFNGPKVVGNIFDNPELIQ